MGLLGGRLLEVRKRPRPLPTPAPALPLAPALAPAPAPAPRRPGAHAPWPHPKAPLRVSSADCALALRRFDGCSGPFESVGAMKAALNRTGRPIVYSINHGVQDTNPADANMWR